MGAKPIIFYDGNCGLCNRVVRFVLNADKAGHFSFSPRHGETIKHTISDHDKLPDSIVVLGLDDRIYLKGFAVVYILKQLGGVTGGLGRLLGLLPWRFLNKVYDFIASRRLHLFRKQEGQCPVPPPEKAGRFLV